MRVETGLRTYIGFSTEPGNVALHGDGKHSPFSQTLLDNINRKNLDIKSIMRPVRTDVHGATNGDQKPWEKSSMIGEAFVFKTLVTKAAAKSKKQTQKPIAATLIQDDNAAEITYWNSIKDGKS